MNRAPCRAQVVMAGRRGLLTVSGMLALDAHLGECASCRLDQQLLADFDEDSLVDIRDGARLDRLSSAARDWAKRRRAASRGRRAHGRGMRVWYLAASLLLLAGAAGAATWWATREPSTRAKPAAPARRTLPARTLPAPSVLPAVAPSEIAPAEKPRTTERTQAARRPAQAASSLTPASLLRQAGEARKEGHGERALVLYRRLQRDFSGSPEAALSRVPVGNLLLEGGRVREARVEFERYLAASPDGVLVAEALYGRARSLTALGKSAEALRAWQRLVREFPSSAYVPLARRRIAESP
jgi:TolA-binding protein